MTVALSPGPPILTPRRRGAGGADLAGVEGDAAHDRRDRLVQRRVTQHDLRRLAAELEVDRDEVLGAGLHDPGARAGVD
jgi:hypothetical protein